MCRQIALLEKLRADDFLLETIPNHQLEEAMCNKEILRREVAQHQHRVNYADPLLSRVA